MNYRAHWDDVAGQIFSAMQADEFVLYNQPIVALAEASQAPAVHEVFVRMREEDERLLPPGSFFPLIQQAGLLPVLDRWVVNRLARHVRAGLRADPAWNVPHYIVNLAGETLADPDFAPYVLQYADDSYLANGVLGFDVPREAASAHLPGVCDLMEALRPHGCTLTVAGFDGSDEARRELEVLAPEFVKISAVSVKAEDVPEMSRVCHELGAQTIVEHVEDGEVLERLRGANVDFGQGYRIAAVEPM